MVVGAKHLYWAGTDLHSLLTITCLHNKAAVVTIVLFSSMTHQYYYADA